MVGKSAAALLLTAAALLAVAGPAAAHATVFPRSAGAGSFERFALRVPTEKETATTRVRMEIPAEFEIARVQPLPGWTYAPERDAASKNLTAITWSGGQILPGEFQEFGFQGKTAAAPGRYAFRVFQTYADGETVAWSGPSDAKTPAAVVELTPASTVADSHGVEQPKPGTGAAPAGTGTQAASAPAVAPGPAAGTGNWSVAAAAYGGLLLGALALALALRRR